MAEVARPPSPLHQLTTASGSAATGSSPDVRWVHVSQESSCEETSNENIKGAIGNECRPVWVGEMSRASAYSEFPVKFSRARVDHNLSLSCSGE